MIAAERIGLIINPYAGQGYQKNAAIASQLITLLNPKRILTGIGQQGESLVTQMGLTCQPFETESEPGRWQTVELARTLAGQNLDCLAIIGGDGTMADAATGIIEANSGMPILGIGVGSTNVGNLITCKADDLSGLTPDQLGIFPLNALLAYHEKRLLGIGFNDCAIGFTVVGTIKGKICNVDVKAKMRSENVPGIVRPIGTSATLVKRIFNNSETVIASGEKVAALIIGFAEPQFIGKAVTGGICLASYTGVTAGCLVADQPLVQVELSRQDVLDLPPITSHYTSINESAKITITGVLAGAGVNVDGTPLKTLSHQDTITFTVKEKAINTIRVSSMKG